MDRPKEVMSEQQGGALLEREAMPRRMVWSRAGRGADAADGWYSLADHGWCHMAGGGGTFPGDY